MGRARKPTAAKILQGTFRKDRAVENEVQYEPITNFDPPEWMDGLALLKWQELEPKLAESGVMTAVDLHNLEAFCTSYANYREAHELVLREGFSVSTLKGGTQKNPNYTALNEALSNMDKFGAKLGIDPSSRTKLSGKAGKKDNEFSNL